MTVSRRHFTWLSLAFITLASLWISHRSNTRWDYPIDAGPPIDALVHLRIHEFLDARPIMGPLSLLLRAPFAALGQLVGHGGRPHDYLDDYRFGVFPCLMAAGLFGIYLARMMDAAGRRGLLQAAVVVLSVLNPVSLRAIHFGHPEEVLGAVLLAGSAVAAIRGRPWVAALLLALAVANKQWALIGLPAVVLILIVSTPRAQLKGPAIVLVAISALLVVPLLIVDAHSFFHLFKRLGDLRGTYLFPADIWFRLGSDTLHGVQQARGLRELPEWLGLIARPLILAVGVVVPLVFARRVAGDVQRRALPLLALVMLLRCMLDPADNGYYHLPFFMALLAADARTGRLWATAAAVVFLQAPTTLQPSAEELNAFYICWSVPFAVYLAGRTWGFDWGAVFRTRVARGPVAERTLHPS